MASIKLRAGASTFVPSPAAPVFVPTTPTATTSPSPLKPDAKEFQPSAPSAKLNIATPVKSLNARASAFVPGSAAAPAPVAILKPTQPAETAPISIPKPVLETEIVIVESKQPTRATDIQNTAATQPTTEPLKVETVAVVEKPAETSISQQTKLDLPAKDEAPKTPKSEVAKPGKPVDKSRHFYPTDFLLSFQQHCTAKLGDFPDLFALFDERSKSAPAFAVPKSRAPRGQKLNSVRPMRPVETLQRSESGYTIKKDTEGLEKLNRTCKSILNKLTPEKLDSLVERAKSEIVVTNPEELKEVVMCVFEKALAEPLFSATYAQFCVKMVDVFPKFNPGKESITFKRCLLNTCQVEFEKPDKQKTEKDNAPTCTSPPPAEENDPAREAKRRMLGSIRFIGELFVRQQLTHAIMVNCINSLLANMEDESLEVLCQLLETVGAAFSKAQEGNIFLDGVFVELRRLTQEAGLSSRIKFLILDVIDMRAKGWVPRIKKQQPKKVSEVKKEEKQERIQQQEERARLGTTKSANRLLDITKRANKDRFSIPTPGVTPGPTPQKVVVSDEWHQASGKKKKGGKNASPEKKKKAALEEDENPSKVLFKNAFTALGDQNENDDLENDVTQEEGGEEDKGEDQEGLADSVVAEEEITEAAESELKTFFFDYFMEEESLSSAQARLEKFPQKATLVMRSLVFVVELKEADEKLTLLSTLLNHLHKEGVLNNAHCVGGMHMFLPQMADLCIDNPHCVEQAADVFSSLDLGFLPIKSLNDVPQEVRENGKLESFVGSLLRKLSTKLGLERTQEALTSSGVRVASFVRERPNNPNFFSNFVSKWNLDALTL